MGAVITWFQYAEITGADNSYQVMCKQYIKRQFYRGKLRKLWQGKKKYEGACFYVTTHCYWKCAKEWLKHNYWFLLKSSETKDQTHHAGQRGKQKTMDRITFPAAAFKMDKYGNMGKDSVCEEYWKRNWNNWSRAAKNLRNSCSHSPWKWAFGDISKNKMIICNNVPEW